MSILLKSILTEIEKHPTDIVPYKEFLSVAIQTDDHEYGKEFRNWCGKVMFGSRDKRKVQDFHKLWEMGLCFDAKVDFDCYLRYVEHNKPLAKQFYQPRRRYLWQVAKAYQEVEEGKVDLLVIEMIKRAGKSQMGINFCNWISGKRPTKSTLMEGTGDDLVRSFYSGCLEYLNLPSDYSYYDIFPESPLVQTNADTKIINLAEKNRFPTIMCRSIDSRQVGLSEATNLLYLDDCVEGREEAKNRQRLDDKWEVISGDILGRAIEGTPIVICGTRYSIYDPMSRLIDTGLNRGWRIKEIKMPAIRQAKEGEEGAVNGWKSNYEFALDGKKIFTTQFFIDQKEILSDEQWESEFMQEPFEAKGLCLPPDELNYFTQLPADYEPDYIIAVGDTAEGGGDYVAMPVAAIYGTDVYIVDVVYDNSPPDVTKAECADTLIRNKVGDTTWESNSAGTYFARDVEEMVKARGVRIGFRTRRTIHNKRTRIELASDNIKRNFFFRAKESLKPQSQYAQFLKSATSYTRSGKNKHDDAIDSLAMLENEIRFGSQTVEIKPRFF